MPIRFEAFDRRRGSARKGEETNRSAFRSSNEIRDRVSDQRSSIVSVSNWIEDGLVVTFFFVRALPLRSPAFRWIFSLLTSNCFYHLFYVFVHGGLHQESMKIDRRIGLLKTGVPVFLAFSPLGMFADVQRPRRLATGFPMASPGRFLTPTLTPTSDSHSSADPLAFSASSSSRAAAIPHLLPFFPLSSSFFLRPLFHRTLYLLKERQPVKKQTCRAACYAPNTQHRQFFSR